MNIFKKTPKQFPLVLLHIEGFDYSPEGYLVGIEGEHYVLKHAKINMEGDNTKPFDGEFLLIPKKRVILVQILSGTYRV